MKNFEVKMCFYLCLFLQVFRIYQYVKQLLDVIRSPISFHIPRNTKTSRATNNVQGITSKSVSGVTSKGETSRIKNRNGREYDLTRRERLKPVLYLRLKKRKVFKIVKRGAIPTF